MKTNVHLSYHFEIFSKPQIFHAELVEKNHNADFYIPYFLFFTKFVTFKRQRGKIGRAREATDHNII
jgi:hypothetical protein